MIQEQERQIDYAYYQDLWENPQPSPELFSPRRWDARADKWVQKLNENPAYRKEEMERVAATAGFLRSNGQLGPGSRVLDIGCGPGLFTAEFAKTAGYVTALDLSPRMLHHANAHSKAEGATNTSFIAYNFKQADIDALGWRKKFDLVMSCLTPAITSVEDLHKIMDVSRGHCLHVSFVQSGDSLKKQIASELFSGVKSYVGHWNGTVFYSVFNLLFLEGYHPKTFYFSQTNDRTVMPNRELAERYADFLKKDFPEKPVSAEMVLSCMEKLCRGKECLTRKTEDCYGYILWDVNSKRPQNAFS